MRGNLDALFRPRSVAVVGASTHPEKMGHVVLKNLVKGKFRIYPVNPKESGILGLPCYPTVEAIPGEVDLAVITLPASASLDGVRACASKGVKVVIVASSGFKESGPEGKELEERLLSAVAGTATRILGPNTMGVLAPSTGLDTLLIPRERSRRPRSGSIAMVSQSGAVSVSFLEKARASGLGISVCVGLGNKCDISENEVLEYLSSDKRTKSIGLYLESFSNGREFVQSARALACVKPLVVLKSGSTGTGMNAASSHTGALAASDPVVEGVFRQCGIVRAYDEEELLDLTKALAMLDHIAGDRVCVVASAGGFGVIASDYVESKEHGAGMRMARLSELTIESVRAVAPGFSSLSNPVDLTAGVTDEMYDEVLGIIANDQSVDCILMSLELQPPNVTDRLIDIAKRRSDARRIPLVVSAFAGPRTDEVIRKLARARVPAYPNLWRTVRAIRALYLRGRYLNRPK